VLGNPDERYRMFSYGSDMDFVTDKKAIEYLKSFPKKKRVDFQEIFPGATADAVDFLEKSLQFNPRKRITID
jgi:mitogen-activated protein kinase 1/3